MPLLKIFLITLNLQVTIYGGLNYNTDGGQLIITGEVCNFVQISTNNWKMPVYAPDYVTGYVGSDGIHSKGNSETNFKYLTDWFETPTGQISIGDVMIGYGIGLLIYNNLFQ